MIPYLSSEIKENVKKISADIRENERYIQERCENCADILIRPMRLGDEHKVDCLMVYIEVAVSLEREERIMLLAAGKA